jgi:hypothetical protein
MQANNLYIPKSNLICTLLIWREKNSYQGILLYKMPENLEKKTIVKDVF